MIAPNRLRADLEDMIYSVSPRETPFVDLSNPHPCGSPDYDAFYDTCRRMVSERGRDA